MVFNKLPDIRWHDISGKGNNYFSIYKNYLMRVGNKNRKWWWYVSVNGKCVLYNDPKANSYEEAMGHAENVFYFCLTE